MRWITNVHESALGVGSWIFGANHTITRPKETTVWSVDRLEQMGYAGVYEREELDDLTELVKMVGQPIQ